MVKELIDVEWGQAVIDNLSSNEVYDILGDICTSQMTPSLLHLWFSYFAHAKINGAFHIMYIYSPFSGVGGQVFFFGMKEAPLPPFPYLTNLSMCVT